MVTSAYTYHRSEANVYTVGYYDADNRFYADSDHPTSDSAAARVHYLNGGSNDDAQELRAMLARLPDITPIPQRIPDDLASDILGIRKALERIADRLDAWDSHSGVANRLTLDGTITSEGV